MHSITPIRLQIVYGMSHCIACPFKIIWIAISRKRQPNIAVYIIINERFDLNDRGGADNALICLLIYSSLPPPFTSSHFAKKWYVQQADTLIFQKKKKTPTSVIICLVRHFHFLPLLFSYNLSFLFHSSVLSLLSVFPMLLCSVISLHLVCSSKRQQTCRDIKFNMLALKHITTLYL